MPYRYPDSDIMRRDTTHSDTTHRDTMHSDTTHSDTMHSNTGPQTSPLSPGYVPAGPEDGLLALQVVARGILGGQAPDRFMSTIDAAHHIFGNLQVMHMVKQLLGAQGGLPAAPQRGMTPAAGPDLSAVRVYQNAAEPARFEALAFTQGNDIYLGPGQERQFAHELGHVVQQQRGQVAPTGAVADAPVNEDPGLEREATMLGKWALAQAAAGVTPAPASRAVPAAGGDGVVQLAPKKRKHPGDKQGEEGSRDDERSQKRLKLWEEEQEAGPSKEKQHKCDWPGCGEAYEYPGQLTAHMRSHTGETERYQCDMCDMQFQTRKYLQDHRRKYHEFYPGYDELTTSDSEIELFDSHEGYDSDSTYFELFDRFEDYNYGDFELSYSHGGDDSTMVELQGSAYDPGSPTMPLFKQANRRLQGIMARYTPPQPLGAAPGLHPDFVVPFYDMLDSIKALPDTRGRNKEEERVLKEGIMQALYARYQDAWDFYTEVRPSTLPGAGKGLFARRPIPAGTFIGPYTGVRLSESEATRMRNDPLVPLGRRVYFMWVSKSFPKSFSYFRAEPDFVIDGWPGYLEEPDRQWQEDDTRPCHGSRINACIRADGHCDLAMANVIFRIKNVAGRNYAFTIATQAIQTDDELFADYGSDYISSLSRRLQLQHMENRLRSQDIGEGDKQETGTSPKRPRRREDGQQAGISQERWHTCEMEVHGEVCGEAFETPGKLKRHLDTRLEGKQHEATTSDSETETGSETEQGGLSSESISQVPTDPTSLVQSVLSEVGLSGKEDECFLTLLAQFPDPEGFLKNLGKKD